MLRKNSQSALLGAKRCSKVPSLEPKCALNALLEVRTSRNVPDWEPKCTKVPTWEPNHGPNCLFRAKIHAKSKHTVLNTYTNIAT